MEILDQINKQPTYLDNFKITNKRILICVNTLTDLSSFVYGSHIALLSNVAKKRPDLDIIFFTPIRTSIDMARNLAAKQAMQDSCDYLMFIDDDVLVQPDCLFKLLEADKDIVCGHVIIRGYPFNNMMFKRKTIEGKDSLVYFNDLQTQWLHDDIWYTEEEIKDLDKEKLPKRYFPEVQNCDAVGFSCVLIKVDLIRAIEPPYFVTGPHNTEDVYFCMKAQEQLDEVTIAVHTGVECGHLMQPEVVEPRTAAKFREFYREQSELMAPKIAKRDNTYMEKCLTELGK